MYVGEGEPRAGCRHGGGAEKRHGTVHGTVGYRDGGAYRERPPDPYVDHTGTAYTAYASRDRYTHLHYSTALDAERELCRIGFICYLLRPLAMAAALQVRYLRVRTSKSRIVPYSRKAVSFFNVQ